MRVESLHIGYTRGLIEAPITMQFEVGNVYVIGGDNGVGKSTFLKTLVGLIPPLAGKVIGVSEKVGYLDSSKPTSPYISVRDYWAFGLGEVNETQKEKLKRGLGFDESESKLLEELSDGQFRKVALIRQLLKEPNLLVLDEPTVYLDQRSKESLIQLIQELKKSMILIVSSHDKFFMDSISDRWLELSCQEITCR